MQELLFLVFEKKRINPYLWRTDANDAYVWPNIIRSFSVRLKLMFNLFIRSL